jgi:hypothetical protein
MSHICTVVRYGWDCCHHRWSLICKTHGEKKHSVWNNLHITADIIFRPTMTHIVISLRGQLDIQRQALRHDIYNDGSRHWARGPDCKFKKTPQAKSDGVNNGSRSDGSDGQMVNFIYSEPSEVVLTTVDKDKSIDYLDQYDIQLDNQCAARLFHNRDLSTNIHRLPNPIPFTGLGSFDFLSGTNTWFGDVYYSAESRRLSFVLSFVFVWQRIITRRCR